MKVLNGLSGSKLIIKICHLKVILCFQIKVKQKPSIKKFQRNIPTRHMNHNESETTHFVSSEYSGQLLKNKVFKQLI
jgi:hypothetical protein